MPKGLRDPSIGLDCTETPFRPPKTLSRADLAVCNSCNLYFNAKNVGPKDLRPLEKGGLLLNESPLIQLEYNQNTYGLSKTYIWPQGIHRDFKVDKNYDLELNLYFRDIYFPEKQLAVSIPITIDNEKGMSYFSEINTNIRNVTIDSIINRNAPVLVYKGIDIQGRDDAKIQKIDQCNSLDSNLTWYIFPTAYIKQADADRIRRIALPKSNSNPSPDHEITLARARQMCMIIPNILTKPDPTKEASGRKDVFLTRALQCQRIDPSTDVKGDAVYLNGSATTTSLSSELDSAASLNNSIESGPINSIRAKTIEDLIALVVGIAIGIILVCVIAYFIFTIVYKGYLKNVIKQEAAILTTPLPCKPAIII
jgi:hypothetical protein